MGCACPRPGREGEFEGGLGSFRGRQGPIRLWTDFVFTPMTLAQTYCWHRGGRRARRDPACFSPRSPSSAVNCWCSERREFAAVLIRMSADRRRCQKCWPPSEQPGMDGDVSGSSSGPVEKDRKIMDRKIGAVHSSVRNVPVGGRGVSCRTVRTDPPNQTAMKIRANQSRQPTPVEPCGSNRTSVARRGCARRSPSLPHMRTWLTLLLLCALCLVAGCSAIGSRVVGERYFSGVRCDYAMCFERSRISPESRTHPALAVVDTPFSLVADILFLPYDAYQDCQSSGSTNVATSKSHE